MLPLIGIPGLDTQLIVNRELHEIYRLRSRFGILPHILVIIASIFFQRKGLFKDQLWIIVLLLVSLGVLGRTLITGPLYEGWVSGKRWSKTCNALSFLLLALGWGVHFWDVHDKFGASSANVAYTLLILVGFITSSSTTLIGDKTSFYIFILTLTCSVIYTFLTDDQMSYTYIVFFILLYLIFSIWNYRVGHQQLYSVLKAKVKSKKEEERLKNIINAVPGFVTLYDSELKCYLANASTLKYFPDLVGQKLGEFTYKTNVEKVALDFWKSGKFSQITEYQTVIQEREVFFLTTTQKLPDGGLIIVSTDITELHEARQKLREQEAKTLYTAKLVSLGEMAAGIAHEVNNPLTIIQGSARIAQKLSEEPTPDLVSIRMLCGKMVDTCERISRTIKSLKALSRTGENDPIEEIPVKSIIEQCLDVCGQMFKRHDVELKLSDVPDNAIVKGRSVQLGQVLLNLISNAIDAVKGTEYPWIEISVLPGDRYFDILVEDSGAGILPEHRGRIMEPFFTTKDVNHGTGLGLSISKRIMQDHNGELSLLEDREHTTFRMRIPIS